MSKQEIKKYMTLLESVGKQPKEYITDKVASLGVPFKIKDITEDDGNTYSDGVDFQVHVLFKPKNSADYKKVFDEFILPFISYDDGHFLFKLNNMNDKIIDVVTVIRAQ